MRRKERLPQKRTKPSKVQVATILAPKSMMDLHTKWNAPFSIIEMERRGGLKFSFKFKQSKQGRDSKENVLLRH